MKSTQEDQNKCCAERQQLLKNSLVAHLKAEFAKELPEATQKELWTALSMAIMEQTVDRWVQTSKNYQDKKRAHYFSAEFLVGRSLLNNLVNLNWSAEAEALCEELGLSLDQIEEQEEDPGLGNGGLGRLAACFLDSAATQNLPVVGYGILYRYGLFRQTIENGFQKEYPDTWMENPHPFHVSRTSDRVLVHYQDMDVWAVPYLFPITGYHTQNVNTLCLWRPQPAEEFDFNLFNSQRFDDAVVQRNRVEDIYRVLYPNDTSYDGKLLRVRQQYFFVSASVQSLIKDYVREHGTDFSQFPKYNVMQLNDTHPVLAIPELIRLLVDEQGLPFDKAWEIARQSFAYTNHTVMAEALEKWDVSIFQYLFPRILDIIKEIDRRFRSEAQSMGLQHHQIEALSPLHDGKVHMAWLASYTSFKINGVAAIHTGILKRDTLKEFNRLWPDRIVNKTNGVTPRRWLRICNPELAQLLTEALGSEAWVTDLDQLKKLEPLAEDPTVIKRLQTIKLHNKEILSKWVKQRFDMDMDPHAVYDIQVKRLHEYKRQLLNALDILDRYYAFKKDPSSLPVPVNFIFAAKAAPGYFRAKSIIKFINEVARLVNSDPDCQGHMKVFFLPNYSVTMGERIFPAADISEQISTVGKEASGTSNMKFMMNGALTLGTWDGANLEICDAVGQENSFMFGAHLEDFPSTLDYYYSQWQYEHIPGLKRVVDTLVDGTLNDDNSGMFKDLHRSLLQGTSYEKADVFYVLGDFSDYRNRRQDALKAYQDPDQWAKMCWINICRSGRFSSDRTIQEYAKEIWGIEPHPIKG